MNKKLTGKAALVTGGSRGIGAAIARSLAEDGADVAISYVSSPEKAKALVRELQEKGVRAVAFQADQAKPDEVGAARQQGGRAFRPPRHPREQRRRVHHRPGGQVNDEDVAKQFAINVGGVNAAVREAAKLMTEGGRIISIGSMARGHFALAGHLGLLGDQGGRCGLHARLGARLGPKGITVNVVEPGPIDTDMNPAEQRLRDSAESGHRTRPLRPAGRSRRNRRVPREQERGLHHRRQHRGGWRLQRRSRLEGMPGGSRPAPFIADESERLQVRRARPRFRPA